MTTKHPELDTATDDAIDAIVARETAPLMQQLSDSATTLAAAQDALRIAQTALAAAQSDDTAAAARIGELTSQVAVLTAQIAALGSGSTRPTGGAYVALESKITGMVLPANMGSKFQAGQIVSVPAGVFEGVDFDAKLNDAVMFYGQGIVGAGPGKTILQVRPKSSTAAGRVPAQTATPEGKINPLYVLRLGPGNVPYGGFTVRGTDQGHMFNGIQLYSLDRGVLENVEVLGIPGNAGFEPGETFGIAVYRGNDVTLKSVTCDGQGVAASNIGVNFTRNFTMLGGKSTGTKYGSGITFYKTTGDVLFQGTDLRGNGFYGVNFEDHQGTVTFDRPVFGGNAKGDIGIYGTKSIKMRIINPVIGPTGRIYVRNARTLPDGKTLSAQQVPDIEVSVDGILRPELLQAGNPTAAT